ncbi:hypothetical protein Dsin_022703 [Dipteronia sinensis]|uniref:Cyclin N-terminal domain-containing protein n=1 Tax=Dipteronia sinensis TaxID=43782 RepID=A0AAE0A1W3_9ROSI|nr:hypothetical protein Dsin_022703 [Dipteronia sinensis]
MEYDPTRPQVREQENFDKYFDVETISMAMEGYVNRRDAAVLRKRALLFLVEFSQKERDVFIPYLALCYFDRFSSREALRVYELELAVVCCLFLASKMRNNSFSVHLFLVSFSSSFEPQYPPTGLTNLTVFALQDHRAKSEHQQRPYTGDGGSDSQCA